MAAFQGRSLTIADGSGEPERYAGAAVSSSLFGLLGTPPALGRDFGPDDDRPGAEPVVLLSDDVWTHRYAADRSVVGRSISINGRAHTVIGVMPEGFKFPETQRLWVPLAPIAEANRRDKRNTQVFARMKPGVTMAQARADLEGVSGRLAATYPDESDGWGSLVRPLRSWMLPDQVELMILAMMCAVTLVLLIACANVANLLLARASVRHREISIRSALGAGRWRIVRQLLTEAVLIGVASAPIGVLLARIGILLVDRGVPPDSIPYFIHWRLDGRTLAYTIGISVLTGVVFGLAPALQAARTDLQSSLKEGGRGAAGGKRARVRNALVVAEVAMSLVLLIGASLFVRSFLNLQKASVGFDTAPLLTMRFYLPGAAYEAADAKARRVQDIARRVEGIPGVESAFASNFVPLGGGGGGGAALVEGRTFERGKEPQITLVGASPRLPKTLGVALVRGRDITDSEETTRTPVALVNQTMAKELWPEVDPIGRRFRLTGRDPAGVVHGGRRDRRLPALSGRQQRRGVSRGVRAVLVRPGAQHRPDDPGDRRSGAAGVRGARADPARRRVAADLSGEHDGGSAPAQLLAVPAVRLDVLDVRGDRAAAGVGRRLRRAVVLGVAAHPGDRRTHGARRGAPRRAAADPRPGHAAGGARHRARPGRRVCARRAS